MTRYETGQTVYVQDLPGESFIVVAFITKRLQVQTSKTAGYIDAPAYVLQDEKGDTLEVLESKITSKCLD